MATTTIYRVQEDTNKLNGAWHSPSEWTVQPHNSSSGHPCPEFDRKIGRGIYDNEYCACISIDSIRHWFTPRELSSLYAQGFSVHSLEIDDSHLIIGEVQVLFEFKDIKSSTRMEITEFY